MFCLKSPVHASTLSRLLAISLTLGGCWAIWPVEAEPVPTASRPQVAARAPQSAPAAAASAPAAPTPGPVEIPKVSLISPNIEVLPDPIETQGNVMPWKETRINSEVGGLRVLHLLVGVGDTVKKGQELAQLDTASVEAEMEAVNAQLMEAQATLAQAEATLDRANRLAPSGGVSKQDLMQFETQAQTATARLNIAKVRVKTQQLKLDSAKLVAPDDGIISSCSVGEGDIVSAGTELFRLIRQGKLEWRAEVKGETLLKLSPGLEATIESPLGQEVKGRIRRISPTIDLKTHTGLAYIDLPASSNFKAGLFVTGTLTIKRKALVLPDSAILHTKEGDEVLTVNASHKVQAVKVKLGLTAGDKTEITSGLNRHSKVIGSNLDKLKVGDLVEIGNEPQVRTESRNKEDKVPS